MNLLKNYWKKEPVYKGDLIYSDLDGDGRIDIVDEGGFRHLHFGNQARQSSIILDSPEKLVLSYTKALMLPLLTLNRIKNILILGLGGGSLPCFFARNFPDCHVDVVEKRQKIVEIAQTYFIVPDTQNLSIYCADAFEFLRSPTPVAYDLIIIDIYSSDGLLKGLNDTQFISSIKGSLTADGIAAFNLIERPRFLFRSILQKISKEFQGNMVQRQLKKRLNHLIFTSKTPTSINFDINLLPKAYEMEKEFGIELPYYLSQFK